MPTFTCSCKRKRGIEGNKEKHTAHWGGVRRCSSDGSLLNAGSFPRESQRPLLKMSWSRVTGTHPPAAPQGVQLQEDEIRSTARTWTRHSDIRHGCPKQQLDCRPKPFLKLHFDQEPFASNSLRRLFFWEGDTRIYKCILTTLKMSISY